MHKLIVKLLFAHLVTVIFTVNGYSQNTERYQVEGDKYMENGDIYNASLNYKKYLEFDSLDKEVIYKYAESLRLLLDYKEAKLYYQKLYKRDRGVTLPESMFWLAMMHKCLGEYNEAKILFEKYNKRFKKKGTYFALKSALEAEACDWALKQVHNPNHSTIIHLDTLINTAHSEFAPFEKDSILYFSSSKISTKKTKSSYPISKNYSYSLARKKPIELDSTFNSISSNSGNISFSADGNTCMFSRCTYISPMETRCAIYMRTKENGKWSAAQRLNDTINQPEFTSTHPCLAKVDSVGTVLYYSSNRKGGEGKMDIWACKIGSNGKFGLPYNLGKNINSMDNEITPYFNSNSQTLYFSSDWHIGFGAFDIFKTKRKNNSYAVPVNLGIPFNSGYHDLYYTNNTTESKSYFSSNREGSFFDTYQNCCSDIYSILTHKVDSVIIPIASPIIVPVKKDTVLKIVNELKLLVPLTLYFDNDEPDSKTTSTTTDKTYTYSFNNYLKEIESYKSNYSQGLKKEKKIDAETEIEAIFADSIEFGMQQLEKFSRLLTRILPEGEHVKITLKGYCSALASSDYNKNLAKRRIACLRNYFASYNNGVLLPYINQSQTSNGGTIEFTEVEIGEIFAYTNDDLTNKRLSVYSPQAALERKIQIIAISSK
jgi:tetratricopeptide (TPR) repeat protein